MKEKVTAQDLDKPEDYDFDYAEDLNEQEAWEDELIQQIDFSEDEDEEETNGLTIKNASKYLEYKPQGKKPGKVEFDASKRKPDIEKQEALKKERKEFMEAFNKRKLESQNAFVDEFL